MFPELLALDVTYSTNAEERPFCLISGIDGHNTTHTHTWILLPSKARWVFEWILNDVLPSLHRKTTLARVRIIVTDQDGQLIYAVVKNLHSPVSSMKNATPRFCAWHKLDRKCVKPLRAIILRA